MPLDQTDVVIEPRDTQLSVAAPSRRLIFPAEECQRSTHLVCVTLNAYEPIFHGSMLYSAFDEALTNFLETKTAVAKQMIRSLRRKNRYMEIFLEYVQGEISKEDFKERAYAMMIEPRPISEKEILEECRIACELAEEVLDSEEISVLLDLEPVDVENTLRNCEPIQRTIA